MSPEMIETARLLMAHPKCPKGLVMHTVSEGGCAYQCGPCGAVVSEEEAEGENCPHCRAGDFPDDWIPERSYPDADCVPDLSGSPAGLANEGPLRARLCALGRGFQLYHDQRRGGYLASVVHAHCPAAGTAAHALALAFLAAR